MHWNANVVVLPISHTLVLLNLQHTYSPLRPLSPAVFSGKLAIRSATKHQ